MYCTFSVSAAIFCVVVVFSPSVPVLMALFCHPEGNRSVCVIGSCKKTNSKTYFIHNLAQHCFDSGQIYFARSSYVIFCATVYVLYLITFFVKKKKKERNWKSFKKNKSLVLWLKHFLPKFWPFLTWKLTKHESCKTIGIQPFLLYFLSNSKENPSLLFVILLKCWT